MRQSALTLFLALVASSAAYTLLPARPIAPAPLALRRVAPCMQVGDDADPPAEPPAAADEPPVDVEAVTEPEQEPAPEPEPKPELEPTAEMASDFPDMDGDEDMFFDESSIAKEALKSEIADGLTGTRPDKAVVGEILLALEAQNPTQSPATSPLLNGKWKFLYASGASPGLKALMLLLRGSKAAPKSPSGADLLDVGDTFLTIQAEQPRSTAEVKVRVLSFENTVKLSSKLEAESAVRLVETYDAAESEYMSFRLPFASSPAQYKRSVLISYLDDEIMVVRDALGRPDVLKRVDAAPDVDYAATGDAPVS